MEAVFSIADKITVLHEGRILVEGTPDEIRSNASVRSVYLGSGRGGTVDRVAAR
jgi:ABC-type branched-subunit amino acid transport system ATPase component